MLLSRAVIDALLPGGSLWVPESNGGLDCLLDGIAGNAESVREFLHTLAHIRNPLLTPLLDDLEREFGIVPTDLLTEAVRRQRLAAVKSATSGDGSAAWMEDRLQAAGFDIYVHVNDPVADPNDFIFDGSVTIFGNDAAQFGRDVAMFGGVVGGLIVNGDALDVTYTIPVETEYWPLIFMVGGAATRDGGGVLTAIAPAEVPMSRKDELIKLIVKYKPMFTWATLTVDYV
jgi:hypothetical protein